MCVCMLHGLYCNNSGKIAFFLLEGRRRCTGFGFGLRLWPAVFVVVFHVRFFFLSLLPYHLLPTHVHCERLALARRREKKDSVGLL